MFIVDNVIANEYWEYGLKNYNFEKIRNDDYGLQNFIRDKYERKRYIHPKKQEPMMMVIQGHDLIREYAQRKEQVDNNNNNLVGEHDEEEEEQEHRRYGFVKEKKGRSFGICGKSNKNNNEQQVYSNNNVNDKVNKGNMNNVEQIQQNNIEKQQQQQVQQNQVQIQETKLIDFDEPSVITTNNNNTSNITNDIFSTIQNQQPQQPIIDTNIQTEKKTGFGFIKKKNSKSRHK